MRHSKLRGLFCLTAGLVSVFTAGSAFAEDERDREPSVIMIMIDGARPDIVEDMAKRGKLPNIHRRFFKGGTWMKNSLTPLALTVPSWSTIFTGVDIDRTGIKGNDVFHRDTKDVDNFLDWRNDTIRYPDGRNLQHGQAYRRIHGAGNQLLTDFFYFNRDEWGGDETIFPTQDDTDVYMTFFPLNNRFPGYLAKGKFLKELVKLDKVKVSGIQSALMGAVFDVSGFAAIDARSVTEAIKVIREKKERKKKLIGIYFASVDHLSHLEAQSGRDQLIQVDNSIGQIFQAIDKGRYSNSTVILISDHGSLGGKELEDENFHNPLRGENVPLTITSLSELLTGNASLMRYKSYGFNVESSFAAEGFYSLINLNQVFTPYQCTDVSKKEEKREFHRTCANFEFRHPELITAAITSSQTISLPYANKDGNDWVTHNNWYTLTNYAMETGEFGLPLTVNLIKDIEDFRKKNLMPKNRRIADKVGFQPLDWLAVSIAQKDFNDSPASQLTGPSDADVVVLHQADDSQALILQKVESSGRQHFKYIPVKNFNQSQNGQVSFEITTTCNRVERGRPCDPLDYLGSSFAERKGAIGEVSDFDWFSGFHTDREWATRYVKTAYPNTVFAITRFMQFRGGMKDKESKLRADIYLNPKYGHMFTVDNDTNEANHGMFQRESVANLFMATGDHIQAGKVVERPVFTTDVVPTVLEAIRRNSPKLHTDLQRTLPSTPRSDGLPHFDGEPVFEIFK